MAAVDESQRDIEIRAKYENPFVSLKFDWTINEYNVDLSKGFESPPIEIQGVLLNFTLDRNKILRLKDNVRPLHVTECYDYLDIRSNFSFFVSGKVTVNGCEITIKKHILFGENKNVTKLCQVNFSVANIVFDLQLYGLKTKKSVFSIEKGESKVDPDECRKYFIAGIQTLWQTHQFSDVQIRVGMDKKTIKAHKSILSARSPVFCRMFQSPTIEGTGDIVDVTDVSFDILEGLVGFLYGCLPEIETMPEEKLSELYYASDKYQVLYLRNVCGSALVNKVTTKNFCRLIDLFDRHSDHQSVKKVVDFCCLHFTDVAKSDGWKDINLKYLTLMLEKMSENCI